MTDALFQILTRRAAARDGQPWVFWHRYWSQKAGGWQTGPYQDRKKLMQKNDESSLKLAVSRALVHNGPEWTKAYIDALLEEAQTPGTLYNQTITELTEEYDALVLAG